MRVAVLGSWARDKADAWRLVDEEGFGMACGQIGADLVHHGHTLLISTEPSERTAEFHVMRAMLEASQKIHPAREPIGVITGNEDRWYYDLSHEYPDLVRDWCTCPVGGRLEARLFKAMEAQAIVILGGTKTTRQVGLAALASGKRVLPIGSFGGAAKQLLDLAASRYFVGISKDELSDLRGPWAPRLKEKLLARLGPSQNPHLLIIHGRSGEHLKVKNLLQNRLRLPEPMIMGEHNLAGRTLPEKFEVLAKNVDGAIAVVTADDLGAFNRQGRTQKFSARARQNVWLEVGWFWGRLGRRRLFLLCKDETEIPSNLQGWEYFRYSLDPIERISELQEFVAEFRSDEEG